MLQKGQTPPDISVNSVSGRPVSLNALRGKKVLVKFHRFSGCPVCRYQTHELIKRQPELNAAGIETLLFMHSSKNKILANFKEVEGLHIIADKEKVFYNKYSSAFSWKKLFNLSTWGATFAAIFKGFFPHFDKFEGGVTGVPSDFLLDETGNIKALKYGKHYGDSWTVEEVLNMAGRS
ncbi:MAG TPA: redoxin domain-containing protein [Ferruginibacter sp.]|nr:redoxin domain-containing protein [Ferruginibacter sp.]